MTKIETTAILEQPVEIGKDCFIGHLVFIRPGCRIGDRTKILPYTFLEGDNIIGSDVSITPHCHITKGMIIEDQVFIGPGLHSMNDKEMVHLRRHIKSLKLCPPIIRRAARIGGGVFILPGIEIGENAVVGAGSVVTKNVNPGEVVYGNPARFIMFVPKEMMI
jgi:UDP-2-acetamido-3-amino-2,3-dideoxy-glucuronate N-acetyltransferase